jgi:hypothetical protein
MTLAEKVEDYLRRRKPLGATRKEIADALASGDQRRITSAVRSLIAEGTVVPLIARRTNPETGATAQQLVYRGPYHPNQSVPL